MRFETMPSAGPRWGLASAVGAERAAETFRPDGCHTDPSTKLPAEVPAGSDLSQDRIYREMAGTPKDSGGVILFPHLVRPKE